jgi:hypothetical protein
VWEDWAGFDGAGMWDLVVERVGPRRGGCGHRGVVVQTIPAKNSLILSLNFQTCY